MSRCIVLLLSGRSGCCQKWFDAGDVGNAGNIGTSFQMRDYSAAIALVGLAVSAMAAKTMLRVADEIGVFQVTDVWFC